MMEAMDMSAAMVLETSAIWVRDHHHEARLIMGIILMDPMQQNPKRILLQ